MTSNHLSEEELELRAQERIAELEKANKELRAETLKRKQEEHRIQRYNKVLEGINRIFGSIVKAETKEELGIACLYVALDVTGSQIGFVGEVGADGLMHDLAISNSGWDECLMYDKTGHRRLPGEHILQGLYGRVINSGKSFFTNDARAHPDSIGVPEGHPPLRSFIGVPLILDGKTIGILGVANREGGYNPEQQEDLEAIAPAVVQVLQRKREEQEREKAEKSLHVSESKYRLLYEKSLDGILLTSPDGTILSANPQACRMFGMVEYEIIQAGREGLVVKDEKLAAALEERDLTGQCRAELTFRRKDGSTFVGDVTSNLFTDADGSIKTSMIIRDITERKQLEEQLRQRAEELKTIMEVVPTPILIGHDPRGENVTGNRMANRFYEARPGENISASVSKDRRFFCKGRELTAKELPIQQAALEDMDVRDLEINLLLPSGKRRTVTISASPLYDTDGHVRGSVGSFIDITGRKEAEAKLKETLDNLEKLVKERTAKLEKACDSLKESENGLAEAQRIAHFGNWDWDIVNNRVYWSDENYRIFGRNPQEFGATYDDFLSYVHPEDRDYVNSAVKEALNGKTYSIDHRIVLLNGEEHVVHEQGEVTFDKKGIPVRMRGVVQDITERRRTEEALARIEKMRVKEIHHRIKNNLQVVSSLLDLQADTFSHLETCKTPEVVEAFMESQNRVISMALIHEELYKGEGVDCLDFAAYLGKLTGDLFSSHNPGNRDVSFKLDLEQVHLSMDTSIPLGIIVNELVSNSFKHAFSAEGKGEIRIKLRKTRTFADKENLSNPYGNRPDKENFRYMLAVSDNGKGIPEDIDFQDTDSLGLQLVRVLVEQIDGCMELRRNQGTEFMIRFNNLEK